MNSDEILTFLDLTRSLSISQTAQNLFLSQSTVSQRLQSLEEELGSVLFLRGRGRRHMQLNARGSAFVPLAERWVELNADVSRWKKSDEINELNIGAHESLNTFILSGLYEKVSRGAAKDRFHLRIRSKGANELYTMLREQEIDLGLVAHPNYYQNIEVEPLFSESYALLLPADVEAEENLSWLFHRLPLRDELFLPWDRYYWNWHNETLGSAEESRINLDIVPLFDSFLGYEKHWLIAPISVAASLAARYRRQLVVLRGEKAPPARNIWLISNKSPATIHILSLRKFKALLFDWIKTNPALRDLDIHV